ncbi:hypothetical protein ACMG4P_22100 [Pseudovibrio denitrificans]|uniref:hypothetical protein n=1 Tax=Pseudovibrio denitrificans TaxID=258256 RepID=UPI0039BF49C7
MVTNVLEILVLFVSLGLFFDKVLIGASEREKISEYLNAAPRKAKFSVQYFDFLDVSHAMIFDRFFSGGLFSISFFRSAAVVSVSSFIFVATFQILYEPSILDDIDIGIFQVIIIVVFLSFNVLFDYITIAQTKIFIESSISSGKIFNSIFLIISDFIVSLNLFIIFYALFILFITLYLVSPVVDLTFYQLKASKASVVESKNVPEYLTYLDQPAIMGRIKYNADINGLLQSKGEDVDEEHVIVFYDATFEPKVGVTEKLILSTLPDVRVQFDGEFQDYSDVDGAVARKLTEQQVRLFDLSDEDKDEDQSNSVQSIKLKVSGSNTDLSSLNSAYTQAYTYADRLEDSFPISFALESATLSLRSFVADISSANSYKAPIAICLLDSKPTDRFPLTPHSVKQLQQCDDFIIVRRNWRAYLTQDLATTGRNLQNKIVPFNTLIITSMLPTILFYIAIMFLAVASVVFLTLASWAKEKRKYFVRSPFAVSGFLIGIVFGALAAF